MEYVEKIVFCRHRCRGMSMPSTWMAMETLPRFQHRPLRGCSSFFQSISRRFRNSIPAHRRAGIITRTCPRKAKSSGTCWVNESGEDHTGLPAASAPPGGFLPASREPVRVRERSTRVLLDAREAAVPTVRKGGPPPSCGTGRRRPHPTPNKSRPLRPVSWFCATRLAIVRPGGMVC